MYEVKLDAFEGPLDLLLHLIQKFEIDIYDISMKHLTEQYLNYIHSVQDLDINTHGDYLVMASELLRIKSKMLLPQPQLDDLDEDPRDALVHQLLEYQNYKYYATLLSEKKEQQVLTHIKAPNDLSRFEKIDDSPLELSIIDLMTSYQKALARRKLKAPSRVVVEREDYSISEATDLIESKLTVNSSIMFDDLFEFNESRHKLVTIFMAMLELMKYQKIQVRQDVQFGEIEISRWNK